MHVCLKVFIYEGSGTKEETESTSKDAAHRQESRVSLVANKITIQMTEKYDMIYIKVNCLGGLMRSKGFIWMATSQFFAG